MLGLTRVAWKVEGGPRPGSTSGLALGGLVTTEAEEKPLGQAVKRPPTVGYLSRLIPVCQKDEVACKSPAQVGFDRRGRS